MPPTTATTRPATTGETVTVACNLPNGLVLRTFRQVIVNELVMGGGSREVKVAEPTGEDVVLRGNRVPFGRVPEWPIVGGYALTENVSKDVWDEWLKDNHASAMIKNRCVFALPHAKAADAAREAARTPSGLEPFKPTNPDDPTDRDPRAPRAPANLTPVVANQA